MGARRWRSSLGSLGVLAILLGGTTLSVTALGGWGTAPAGATSTGQVFLAINMTDAVGGQFPTGSSVTVTANLTNSSANFNIGDATPTITVSYAPQELQFLSNGAGWTCSAGINPGQQLCTDGLISAGASESLPLTFSAQGNPGDDAFVSGTVTDGQANVNSASFSGQDVTTDSATMANAASFTKGVPPGSFPQKVGGDEVVQTATQANTFTYADGGKQVRLIVPAGALPIGTHISVYRADPTLWASSASSASNRFVDGYAAAWTAQSQSTGTPAVSPVTLRVSDSSVASGQPLYHAVTSGFGPRAGTASPGGWAVSFTADPGYVLLGHPPTTAGPDIDVLSLIAKPLPPRQLSIEAVLKNAGTHRSPSTHSGFYLQAVSPPHSVHLIKTSAVGGLAAGAKLKQSVTAAIPKDLALGSYRLKECADIDHRSVEERSGREQSGVADCVLSDLVITVHKRHHHPGTYVTYSTSPPSAAMLAVPWSPGAPGRTRVVMLLLAGVFLVLAGVLLIGLRRRAFPATTWSG